LIKPIHVLRIYIFANINTRRLPSPCSFKTGISDSDSINLNFIFLITPLFANMKFFTGIALSALLCADAALAGVAANRGLARRLARRAGRRSAPFKNNTLHATVQSNWGGAILQGSGYSAASATVNVPTGGGGSDAAGTAWVGIDGDTCDTAILQTGIDWYGDGTYDAWYEWYPDFSGKLCNGISLKN
jgi:hypothetical protein